MAVVVREFFDLTKKYQEEYGEKMILLMQVGSFMECYAKFDKNTQTFFGSNITVFSQMCELAIATKNTEIDNYPVYMAGFKDNYIEKYVKKIQDAGYTCVIYMQDEPRAGSTRSLAGIFSPGTFFIDDTSKLTNNITCVWIELIENKILLKGKYVVVGMANINIYTGETKIFQFKEPYINNPTTYDELERFISIYNPSEVIIISNLCIDEIDDIINYANIQSSLIHKINLDKKNDPFALRARNCEKQIYQNETLSKFYNITDFDVFIQNFYNNEVATQAFCFLLDFVYQHNPRLVKNIAEPEFENCTDRLILANHSLKQLNVIDDDNYTGKYSSVLKMLNSCVTSMGKRKFSHLFLNPVTNKTYLQNEYDITEHFLKRDSKNNEILRNRLGEIKDLEKYERQVFLKRITPQSFYHLNNNLDTICEIFNLIKDDIIIMKYILTHNVDIKNVITYSREISEFIKKNLVLEIAKEIISPHYFDTNFIVKGFDSNLDNNNQLVLDSEKKIDSIRNYLNSLVESVERKSKITKSQENEKNKKVTEYVKLHETEKNSCGFVSTSRRCKLLQQMLPSNNNTVVLTFKSSFTNEEKEFLFNVSKDKFEFTKQSATNNFIIHQEITELCKNITEIRILNKELISSAYNKFVEEFQSFQKKMECIIDFVTIVDLSISKAYVAKKYNYCKPQLRDAEKSFVQIKELRHCLIEHLQTNELYVSNDITLGNSIQDGVLLYGTNAVGKTSFIRSLGISIIMAQSGLYVPATEFIYNPYKYIFTRIIGNDNIFKGLSTFAVEMSELRTILRLADKDSLILGDELCSGTENTSAISIFVAGIQKMHKLQSSFIFATHMHEITDYEEITQLESVSLKHMSVFYDKQQDVLIYDRKLKEGPGNNMYGLEVCKSLKLPDDFLEAAYQIRMKYNPESGSMLSLKTSHFNSKKIVNMCEMCNKNPATETHHLQHQNQSNQDGIIHNQGLIFHKNNPANLTSLCEECHNMIHKKKVQHKKMKTSKGIILGEL